MTRGGWRTNRKTGGHFYAPSAYSTQNKTCLSSKIGNDVLRVTPRQLPKSYKQTANIESLKTSTILSVLGHAPLISELYAAYSVADYLWSNWQLISELYNIYEKKVPAGLATVIGTDIVKDGLTDVQTEVFWSQISKAVPAPLQPQAKTVVTNVIEKITDAEVDFVTHFLTE